MTNSSESMVQLLEKAVAQGASDLHLSAGLPVALRIDGDIVISGDDPLDAARLQAMLDQVMSPLQREQFEKNLECDFSIDLSGAYRCRVNAYQQFRGAAAAFRLIPPRIRTLDELNCPRVIREVVDRPKGLILVTGQTGAGKSTTLAAMVDHMNDRRALHIITIEDPVEFVHQSRRSIINQREVGRHSNGFAPALRAALREDPDCILVGELRDLETIQLALTAAETGHLVLATLHTNSAAHTLDRLIDVFPPEDKPFARAMLAECLSAVVCQTLVKRHEGGRMAVWEVMVCVPAVRSLIREGKTAQIFSVMQTGSEHGMFTMAQCLESLRRQAEIDVSQSLYL